MSTIVILDRLLDQASTTESKEHVLEQASYAVDNVKDRLLKNYDQLVAEISEKLGHPEVNVSTDPDAEGAPKNPMPAWVLGGKQASDATTKVLRLAYWKREFGISYLVLRMELDSKDRPKYYDVVLGGRRRNRTGTVQMTNLRHADTSFLGWIKRVLKLEKAN